MTDDTSALREALEAAREALPRANETESVWCMLRGFHLRALVDALAAEPEQAQPPKLYGINPGTQYRVNADGTLTLVAPDDTNMGCSDA